MGRARGLRRSAYRAGGGASASGVAVPAQSASRVAPLRSDGLSLISERQQVAGLTERDVIIQALRFWLAETELDCEEQRELEAARREYEEIGGVEAREFFNSLRAADAARDGDSATGCDGV